MARPSRNRRLGSRDTPHRGGLLSLYLLDTTVLIAHLRGDKAVTGLLLELLADGHWLGTSCVNVAEIERGVRPKEHKAAAALLERLRFLDTGDPDPDVAHRLFGRLRDELWQTGVVWVLAGNEARRQQYLTPPADAFFERVVELASLTDTQQDELIRNRLDRGDDRGVVAVRLESGNPRALLAALREAASADDAQAMLARRAERQTRAAKELGRLASMMLAEIEDGAAASASDPDWRGRFGVSRQRAQQVLANLEREGLVQAERLPGPSGRPRKVYRRLEAVS